MFVTAGVCLNTLETNTAVRSCGFSFSGNNVMLTTDKTMGFPCEILVYDIRDSNQISQCCCYFLTVSLTFVLVSGWHVSQQTFHFVARLGAVGHHPPSLDEALCEEFDFCIGGTADYNGFFLTDLPKLVQLYEALPRGFQTPTFWDSNFFLKVCPT